METKRLILSNLKKFFSLLIISFVIISFWRGIWGLMDEFLFPSDYKLSLFIPLFLSILVLIFFPKILDELK